MPEILLQYSIKLIPNLKSWCVTKVEMKYDVVEWMKGLYEEGFKHIIKLIKFLW